MTPGRWSIMLLRGLFNRDQARPASGDFTVVIDGRSLLVRVTRHPRSRRLRLRYDAVVGELRLAMPPRGALRAARQWTEQQHDWIRAQLITRPVGEPVRAGTVLPWRDGELMIAWDAALPRMPRLDGDRLLLGGPAERLAPRVQRWLADQARDELTAATLRLAAMAGRPVASVSVADPRSRWGSCSASGAIRYSWRLIMAPDAVRHAVVAHEVAHLAHMNHGPQFHALAARLTGTDPAAARAWLRAHGPELHHWRFEQAMAAFS